jgi:hypothetical protein
MAMFTVDHEIGIERQHRILIVKFGHPHGARVGERHWRISMFLMQLAKGGDVLIDAERDPKRPIFKKSEQSIQSSGKPGEQMHCFRRIGSHTSSGGCSLSICGMMLFCPIEEATRGPHQRWRDALPPKVLRCSGLDAKSIIPESTIPRAHFIALQIKRNQLRSPRGGG